MDPVPYLLAMNALEEAARAAARDPQTGLSSD
jgi:hypothetical protein